MKPVGQGARGYALAVALLMLVGIAVRVYGLFTSFAADDFAQLAMIEGVYPDAVNPLSRSLFDLFNFSDGSSQDIETLVRSGFYPWWSHPRLNLSMMRPMSSVLMSLDLYLFGDQPLGYHLHSLVWWLAMLAAVAWFFRQLLPARVALLAFGLFVLDEAHGLIVSWIANRNSAASTVFSVLALLFYVRFRQRPSPTGWLAPCALFTASSCFGEYALTIVGYVLAYELVAASGSVRQRLMGSLPLLLPALGFLLIRRVFEYGPEHSGMYVGLLGEPSAALSALWRRFPIYFSDLLFGLRAEGWTFSSDLTFRLAAHPLIPRYWFYNLEIWRMGLMMVGTLSMLAYYVLVRVTCRGMKRDDPLIWLALGGVISMVPAISAYPSSRLMLVPLLGFTAILATFITRALAQLAHNPGSGRLKTGMVALVAAFLLVFHIVVPVEATWSETRHLWHSTAQVNKAVRLMEVDDERLPEQRLVVLNSATGSLSHYIPLIRARLGLTAPRACWVLSGSPRPYWLLRTGPKKLMILYTGGQTAMTVPYEEMFRSRDTPLRAGDRFDLDGMTVQVLAARDGRPSAVSFEFDVVLEDPTLHFLHAGPNGLRRVIIPPVGTPVWAPPATPSWSMAL